MRQLWDVLGNLSVNALEEMPNGGSLTFWVTQESPDPADDQPWVRIDVTDDGPGISPENLQSLFEPFFTTKASGSGLGLTIVQGTIERHGGVVRVSTTPGAGTSFSLFLPAVSDG